KAEQEGRQQVLACANFLRDHVPGFERAAITWMARRAGVREARRVRGRYWLSREDVRGGTRFPDAIAQGAAPIEEHDAGRDTRWEFLEAGYDIPYRCLLPVEVDGMLVAGRCLSASHDAHASARNMAQCMAMGQAAGTAAAVAADARLAPHAIDPAVLQDRLLDNGALLGAMTAS
ncbi:MAG: FAD-dependent oxidoreductase, partial [Mycobacteriales bacterium]